MKKNMLSVLLVLAGSISAQAFADQGAINQKALEIVLKNSGNLQDQSGKTLALFLAEGLPTPSGGTSQIANVCTFDKSDALFNCDLTIGDASNGLESSMSIHYQLEMEPGTNMPSENLFSGTIEVDIAG